MRAQLRALFGMVLEQRWLVAVGSVFVAVGLVVALSYPMLVKRLIDEGVLAGQRSRVNELALLLLVLAAEGVACVVRDHYQSRGRACDHGSQHVFDHP
jgi:ABC-type multidrug transport system fused ATPase/permease subunit